MMDDATGWIEIIYITNKRSREIVYLVDSEWFCRYPRPLECKYDNGGEFDGIEFSELLESYGIKNKPTTVKNPQANATHERVHLVIAEMLRTQSIKIYEGTTIEEEIRRLLQSVAFAVRTATTLITKYSPGQLIFGRDMIVHCAELVNWDQLWERKAKQHLKENLRENKSRSNYKYKIGGKVLILTKTNERGGKLMDFEY